MYEMGNLIVSFMYSVLLFPLLLLLCRCVMPVHVQPLSFTFE